MLFTALALIIVAVCLKSQNLEKELLVLQLLRGWVINQALGGKLS